MNSLGRIRELDLTKTFIIIISMIGIHTMYELADFEITGAASVLNILATAWGAPVFMFCMGVALCFSHNATTVSWFRRGIYLFTIGMVLNVLRYGPMAFTAHAANQPELMKGLAQIFNVDILQFAGLSFMLLALCKKLKMNAWSILALSVQMNIIGTLLIGCNTSNYAVNQILGYFYHTPTCSCFTLLNWFIFVAAGNLFGKAYVECENKGKLYRYIIPICGVVAIVHQYLSITGGAPFFKTLQNDWEFYSMATPDALCIAFGVAPFMLGIFYLIAKIIPKKWMDVLAYPSIHINQFYCISWVWIMWIAYFLYFIEPATTFASFVPRWIGIFALTTVTIVVYNKFLRTKIKSIFSHYETAWFIVIWLFVVAFGIWYFSTIPGPYIMPY